MQDLLFMTGSLLMLLSLLPTVRHDEKPALATSVLTGSVLAMFAVTYFTMSFYLSAVVSAASSGVWFLLAWQARRSRYDQR